MPAGGFNGTARPADFGGNRTVLKCTACAAPAYSLSGNRCVCAPGYSMTLPQAPTSAPAAGGARPQPVCTRCAAGLVSGPDAPAPIAPGAPSTGYKLRRGARCVACPSGTAANAEQTACV